MAEVKWIKIATNIFDNQKIKVIESMPDGDAIIVIWFKLLMAAGNVNDGGSIYFTKDIPYTDQMLATVFNRPLSTIQLALKTFEKFGMIEVVDDVIQVSNWEKYQNVDGLEKIREQTRARVAKHREQKRIEMQSIQCSYCGNAATGYDHIIATSKGGKDIESNKVPCCQDCNRIKNDKPLVEFLNHNRERVNDELIASNNKLKKFVTLCNVTNRYIVTDGNATEEDIDKEIEKEVDIDNTPPKPPKGSNVTFKTMVDNTELSDNLKNTVKEWLEYKKEIKKPYKSERGFQQFINMVAKYSLTYSDDEIISVINKSMASGYQGVVWDWLEKKKTGSGYVDAINNRMSAVDDWLNDMQNGGV